MLYIVIFRKIKVIQPYKLWKLRRFIEFNVSPNCDFGIGLNLYFLKTLKNYLNCMSSAYISQNRSFLFRMCAITYIKSSAYFNSCMILETKFSYSQHFQTVVCLLIMLWILSEILKISFIFHFCWIKRKLSKSERKSSYRVSHETWQYAGRLECRLDFWYNLLRLFVNLILEVNF